MWYTLFCRCVSSEVGRVVEDNMVVNNEEIFQVRCELFDYWMTFIETDNTLCILKSCRFIGADFQLIR